MNEIREYLEANLQSFNRSQKKIALFVLENPSRIKELELNEFAALSGTSRSTVLRFLQQLGYSGFREFNGIWLCSRAARGKILWSIG